MRLKANTTTGIYLRLERALDLGTLSGPEGMTWLLAHEISHHILGHVNAALKEEMEANAMAVRVLQIWGRSEAEAVRLVESRLLLIRRTGSTLTGQRHDWCAEYHDIVRRYPDYTQPEGAAVCAGATQ